MRLQLFCRQLQRHLLGKKLCAMHHASNPAELLANLGELPFYISFQYDSSDLVTFLQWFVWGKTKIQQYIDLIWFIIHLPVVPARGGAEVALKIYKRPFSSIELACAVRQPSPCVRALCESGVLFHMSHLKLHFALHTSHCTLHTPHCTLHTSHSTLLTSHCTLPNPHFTLHTPHFTLHTSQSTLHTSHFSLLSSHSTLHTALFAPHTSHCTLHTPHFISSELFSPYPSSSLLISSLLICHL